MEALISMLPPSVRRSYRRIARKLGVDPFTLAAAVVACFVADKQLADHGGLFQFVKTKLGL